LSSKGELSKREIEVIKLICLEHTNQEIADQLFLSIRTVESHRQRVLEKVGAKNTVGLVVYAIANEIHPLNRF
jgi:DNA-binding CsgD family transcriptional regulator